MSGQNHLMTHVQLDTNVDDMDPRLWPGVIDKLLGAGADDAWVTPIIMKKGRPAFTLSALCDSAVADEVRAAIFAETTTIGVREIPVVKHVLARDESHVDVQGHRIGVKTAYGDSGDIVNRSVEWDHVIAAASALGLPTKKVLDLATAAAERL